MINVHNVGASTESEASSVARGRWGKTLLEPAKSLKNGKRCVNRELIEAIGGLLSNGHTRTPRSPSPQTGRGGQGGGVGGEGCRKACL